METNEIVENINNLKEVTELNSNFLQSIAQLLFDTADTVGNIYDSMSAGFRVMSERLDLIELSQNVQLELIELITKMSLLATGIGLINTIVIIILAIYVVILHKKIKEKK